MGRPVTLEFAAGPSIVIVLLAAERWPIGLVPHVWRHLRSLKARVVGGLLALFWVITAVESLIWALVVIVMLVILLK